jgi:hypothetical protein
LIQYNARDSHQRQINQRLWAKGLVDRDSQSKITHRNIGSQLHVTDGRMLNITEELQV